VYVETDFRIALIKDDDWLLESAVQAIEEHDDLHTSILAYAEVLVCSTTEMTATTKSMHRERLQTC
jgi:hypothetical protein